MRILSAILSIYIVLLTLAPSLPRSFSLQDPEHCKESCCSSEEGIEKSDCDTNKQKGNCNNGICNPFMICCNCYALVTQSPALLPPSNYSDQKFNSITERAYSNFLSETWHPPKV